MKISIISDNEKLAKNISEKLVFLRSYDKIVISGYSNYDIANTDVVLVCENIESEKTIDLIKKIRSDLCVILIPNSYGVDDFILASAEDFEFVIRIINNVKHNVLKTENRRNVKILEQLKVIDEFLGLYNYNYAKQVIENMLDIELIKFGSFMAIAPSDKTKFSTEEFVKLLKQLTRSQDILTIGKNTNFYVFLPNTNMNGAIVVLNKLKENFNICAGISEINENKAFDIFEKEALEALAQASATKAEYVFAEDKNTIDEWLNDCDTKNYKIFKQMFNKKLEKVITPVFYRLQKTYEERLYDTKITQNNEQCLFKLCGKKKSSSLQIIYPGFTKVIILIRHEGLDSPENREIHLQLSDVTQKGLADIVEEFIQEYKEG